ncbi:MAG TPA: hypothetical protein VD905_16210 [Flavobacteriales bacterium]|nr:hypothetical protein [Flavobacteriales bacterium]
MAKQFTVVSVVVGLLSGCYCRTYYNQNSSVRFLRGSKSFTICSHLGTGGNTVLATAYVGDPYLQQLKFIYKNNSIADPGFSSTGAYGLRMEKLIPGPVITAMGADYSYNQFDVTYKNMLSSGAGQYTQTVWQHRAAVSWNILTFIEGRTVGYLALRTGTEWSKNKWETQYTQFNRQDKSWNMQFDWRVGYGLQYYLRPLIHLNLELGYGGGAFVKGGVGIWVF